jgi:hypothetical protein
MGVRPLLPIALKVAKKFSKAVSLGVPSDSSESGFSFEPRALTSHPKQFGKSAAVLRPAQGVAGSDPRFQAAQLQHRVANSVREALLSRGSHLLELSQSANLSAGMKYNRLVRIQRGETLMQLADLMNWSARYEEVAELLAHEQFGFQSDHF